MNTGSNHELAFRLAPKAVHYVAVLATLIGVLSFARILANSWAGSMTMTKALLYGALIGGVLFLNGFSIIGKSRPGYVIVAAVAAFPMLGLLAQSLHLFVLFISGGWRNEVSRMVVCGLCLCQLVATGVMFFFLLSRPVRDHVWKNNRQPVADQVRHLE